MEEFGEFDNDIFYGCVKKVTKPVTPYKAKQYESMWFNKESCVLPNDEINRLRNVGNWLYRCNNYQQALHAFLQAAELSRVEQKDLHESIIRCHACLGHREDALDCLRLVRNEAKSFDQVTAMLHLSVFVYTKLHMICECISSVKQLCTLHEAEPSLWCTLADCYARCTTQTCQAKHGTRVCNACTEKKAKHRETCAKYPHCPHPSTSLLNSATNRDNLTDDFSHQCNVQDRTCQDSLIASTVGLKCDKETSTLFTCDCSCLAENRGLDRHNCCKYNSHRDTHTVRLCHDNGDPQRSDTNQAAQKCTQNTTLDRKDVGVNCDNTKRLDCDVDMTLGDVTYLRCCQLTCLYKAQLLLKAVERNLRSFAVENNRSLQEKVANEIEAIDVSESVQLACVKHVQCAGYQKEHETETDDRYLLSLLARAESLIDDKWLSWIQYS